MHPLSELTPDLLLRAYASGIFPMAESAEDDSLFWVNPEERGIIPLDGFHLPRRLAKTIRQDRFRVCVDQDFAGVLDACAEPTEDRRNTWINAPLKRLYLELFARGNAHSVECWDEDGFAGGLFGVSLRGAFFGESMVSFRSDASKVALAHLVARLRTGGYHLLDLQFVTEHLSQFGAREITREAYHRLLGQALSVQGDFLSVPSEISGAEVVQLITETS